MSAVRFFATLLVLPLAVAAVPPAAPAASRPLVLSTITPMEGRQAGVGGTGCWWRARSASGPRFAMSGRVAVARVDGTLLTFEPGLGARDLFPFTFDRWAGDGTTVRVLAALSGQRSGSETLDVPARLVVIAHGRRTVLVGDLSCGS